MIHDDWTFGGTWPCKPRWYESADSRPHYVDQGPQHATPERQIDGEVARRLEAHRWELTRRCRWLLGSAFEAEDAVQETFMRAWRAWDGYEGRAALYSWLYRIATNVCFDMLRGRQRRADPSGLMGSDGRTSPAAGDTGVARWHPTHVGAQAWAPGDDPAERAVRRESIRLAFLAALRRLPRRQRAVLILCDVLRWKADEAAELLGSTAPAVNSALQRARGKLAAADASVSDASGAVGSAERELLARYVDAFERTDIDSLIGLL
jgi:RNA polymerase sigma-70 factor (ECF subfamily)